MNDTQGAEHAIPEHWKRLTIGEIGNVVTGSTPSTKDESYWNGDVPFISPADFNKKVYVGKTGRTLSLKGAEISRLLPRNAILVTCIGSLGGIAISSKPSTTNQQINAVVVKDEECSRFHFYNILFNIHELEKNAGTTTLPIINKSTFELIRLLRPPFIEQQKIAKILMSVDQVLEKTQAQIDKLKDLKTGMMQELLTNGIGHTEFKDSPVGRIPAEWEVVTLGDVTIESAFGPRFSSDEYAPDGNFGCIRTTDMDENWDVNYSTAPLARLNFKEFEKHILVDGDLLVTRSGTCGLVDVFREQPIPMVAAAFLIRFRLTDNVIPQFVKYLMMSTDIQESVQLLASGGVQKNLSGTSLKTLKIPKPSIQEQIKIVKAIESINNRLANSNKKLSLNKKLKKALMQDLLTGKVRVKINS